MAAVRLEDSVWKSWRYRLLGNRCGRDRYWAIGFMASIYSECTERNTDIMRIDLLEELAKECGVNGFVDAMIAVELCEPAHDGKVRVRGCVGDDGKSRISWLSDSRTNARKGGTARVENATRDTKGRLCPAELQPSSSRRPAAVQPESSPLTLTPSLILSLSTEEELLPSPDPDRTDLDKIYKLYPRKEGKARGMDIAKRLVPAEVSLLDLAVRNYAVLRKGQDVRFTMWFSTFMAKETWRDYVEGEPMKVRPELLPPPRPPVIPEEELATKEQWAELLDKVNNGGFGTKIPTGQA